MIAGTKVRFNDRITGYSRERGVRVGDIGFIKREKKSECDFYYVVVNTIELPVSDCEIEAARVEVKIIPSDIDDEKLAIVGSGESLNECYKDVLKQLGWKVLE